MGHENVTNQSAYQFYHGNKEMFISFAGNNESQIPKSCIFSSSILLCLRLHGVVLT